MPDEVLDEVDFPIFVTELIEGMFDVNVDISIQQMETYFDLLKNVAKSMDEFMTTTAPA